MSKQLKAEVERLWKHVQELKDTCEALAGATQDG